MTKPSTFDGVAIVEAIRLQNEILERIATSLDSINREVFGVNADGVKVRR